MDMMKFQQTRSEEGYVAENLPSHLVGMVPQKFVATRWPQHGDPDTSVLGHRFLGSVLQPQPPKSGGRDSPLQLDRAML